MLAELKLLLLILGEAELPENTDPSLLTAGIDWDALVTLAESHRVIPLLFEQCKNAPDGMIPPRIFADLHDRAQGTAADNLALVGELLKLLDAFAGAGIGVIPFKGPLLAWDAYGSFALREPGDLDLLVRRDDIVRARNLLVSMGLRPFFPTATPAETAYLESLSGPRQDRYVLAHCEHHLLRDDGEVNIDLHWNVIPHSMAVALDPEMLWRRTRTVKLAGMDVLTLGREELLLVLCLNGAKDAWGRLDRICDVARLTLSHPDLDFDLVRRIALGLGCTRILLVGLALAKELLSIELPGELVEAISRSCHRSARRPDPTRPYREQVARPGIFQLRKIDDGPQAARTTPGSDSILASSAFAHGRRRGRIAPARVARVHLLSGPPRPTVAPSRGDFEAVSFRLSGFVHEDARTDVRGYQRNARSGVRTPS